MHLRNHDTPLFATVPCAGDTLPGCSIVDLERLTTSLLMMRVTPSRPWVAAAEDQLERLINTHSPRDELQQEQWYEVVEAVVKALALLGGTRAAQWYQDLQKVAAADQEQATGRLPAGTQQQQQHQEEQARWQEQRKRQAAGAEDGALPPHVRRQAAKRGKRSQAGRSPGAAPSAAGTPSKQQASSSRAGATTGMPAPALRSMDEWMTAALDQQLGAREGSTEAAAVSTTAAKAAAEQQGEDLPQLAEVPVPPHPPAPGPTATPGSKQRVSEQQHPLQQPPPAEWAAEQAAKWAAAAAHEPSAAQELHQALDDSLDLVGSVPEVPSSRPAGQKQGAATRAPSAGGGQAGGAAPSGGRQIEVDWGEQPTMQKQQAQASARAGKAKTATGDSSSSSRRLADLMAEVDGAADDANMAAARAEAAAALGMGEESQEEREQLQELQQAADAVQHASDLLDQQLHSKAAGGKHKSKHKGGHSKHSKKHGGDKHTPQPAAGPAAAAGPPLGFSGLKPFEAAAKTLASGTPNKALLSGVLMAVEQQLGELAAKAALKEQGPSSRVLQEEAAAADPVTRAVKTLQDDMERLR